MFLVLGDSSQRFEGTMSDGRPHSRYRRCRLAIYAHDEIVNKEIERREEKQYIGRRPQEQHNQQEAVDLVLAEERLHNRAKDQSHQDKGRKPEP